MGRKLRKAEREALEKSPSEKDAETGEAIVKEMYPDDEDEDPDEKEDEFEEEDSDEPISISRREIDEVGEVLGNSAWEKALKALPDDVALWDHYAAAGLQALGPFIAKELQHYSSPQDLVKIAQFAGGIADAMLKEREKRV